MIGFNELLRNEGIDPATVRLVRHQDTRATSLHTPHELWLAQNGDFETYQSLQSSLVFGDEPLLASFVVTPLRETLFVGLYDIHGHGPAPANMRDPISGAEVVDHHLYKITPSLLMSDYRAKVVVDWGLGYIKWVQLAGNQNKRVIEIRSTDHVSPFPGFLDFRSRLNDLATVPMAWREILQATMGIYLLTHPDTGRQYVGSAQGVDGLWGRWEQYSSNGHGGNAAMREIEPANYYTSILEVVSPNVGAEAILRIEDRWKTKLLTRKFGLNEN